MSFACGHLGKSESDGHRGNTQGPQADVAQDLDISISLCDLQLCRETFALPILGRFETSACKTGKGARDTTRVLRSDPGGGSDMCTLPDQQSMD